MLTKRASTTLTPYALLTEKIREWVPPDGLSLKSYDVKGSSFGITFEVILSRQCEAKESLTVHYTVTHDQWHNNAIDQDIIVDVILDRMYEGAEQRKIEHTGARA